jgi:hypothetical protein
VFLLFSRNNKKRMKKAGDIFKKRIGSDRQTVWILFLFGAILSLVGLFLILRGGGDDPGPAPEIVIRDENNKPPPPPGAGGYSLAPAQVKRQVAKGEEVYLSSAQNRSGGEVIASVRFLPIERQARSGEALYSDNPETEKKGRELIRLTPNEKKLSDGQVFRIRGQVLRDASPALYGMLVVSFKRADSQPFSISSFVELNFPGKARGFAKAQSLRAREEGGAVQFFLAAKNRGNSLVTPRVLFRVRKGKEVVWESRVFGQGILPGMTRDIVSAPYRAKDSERLRAEAQIIQNGRGRRGAALLYQGGRLLFEDGRIVPGEVKEKNLLFQIENTGTESFTPLVEVGIVLPNSNILSLEKNFPKLPEGKGRLGRIALPSIEEGKYSVLYSLRSREGLTLDERDGILEIKETINRPSLLKQGYLPLPLIFGLLLGLLLAGGSVLFLIIRERKKGIRKGSEKRP